MNELNIILSIFFFYVESVGGRERVRERVREKERESKRERGVFHSLGLVIIILQETYRLIV